MKLASNDVSSEMILAELTELTTPFSTEVANISIIERNNSIVR